MENDIQNLKKEVLQKDTEIGRLRSNLEAKNRIEPAVIYSSNYQQTRNQPSFEETGQIAKLIEELTVANEQVGRFEV